MQQELVSQSFSCKQQTVFIDYLKLDLLEIYLFYLGDDAMLMLIVG